MSSQLLDAGLPPAQDRLLTTCFLAALLHGIIILGVTFSAPKHLSKGPAARALEVILVSDKTPSTTADAHAAYLAQRNQRGAGNTLAHERALIPKSSPAPIEHPGLAGGRSLAYGRSGFSRTSGGDGVIVTRARVPRIRYVGAESASSAADMPIRLRDRPDFGMEANDDGVELRLRGKRRQQLWIAADTRAIDVARYLDRWRRHVERIGTLNFPRAARAAAGARTPIIEVTIDADGHLAGTRIRRSSGDPAIDDAAIRILQLAAPFGAFPRKLAARHDQIRIAYQWEFLAGTASGSSVWFAPPARTPPAGSAAGTRKPAAPAR